MKKANSSSGGRIVVAAMGSSGGDCCDMSLKCWCRWRWEHCFLSTTFLFLLSSLVVFGLVAGFFAWLAFPPYDRPESSSLGCQPDSEGSWAIGMFYGDSPFSLKPIESVSVSLFRFLCFLRGSDDVDGCDWVIDWFFGGAVNWAQRNVWKNESSAWPVANPVFTCASASDAGFPSNFVADPFLFFQRIRAIRKGKRESYGTS
ncbi:hypothetical protein ACLOJK_020852 [Asimina triloba]